MQEFLDVARGLPERSIAAGDTLLVEGTRPGALFVLLDGTLQIQKGGQTIATIAEPGVCVGEMSLLLGVPATANVVATEATRVAVIEDAGQTIEEHPNLALALARMLATRLQHMTTYLADLQQQYADHEGGLGMVHTVLGTLLHRPGVRSELGSDRDPEPEY